MLNLGFSSLEHIKGYDLDQFKKACILAMQYLLEFFTSYSPIGQEQ